jgi:hypothetical protein
MGGNLRGNKKVEKAARLLSIGTATTWSGLMAIMSLVFYSDYHDFHGSPRSLANLHVMGVLGVGLLASLGAFLLSRAGQRNVALTLGFISAFFALLGVMVLVFFVGIASH